MKQGNRAINRVGQRYGRLLVVKRANEYPGKHIKYLCKCDCGSDHIVSSGNLQGGSVVSCGCYASEMASKRARERQSKGHGVQATNRVYQNYKHHSIERGLEFLISFDEWLEIIKNPCTYCGSCCETIQKSGYGTGDFKYTGIDRKDNSIGYTLANSVPCCTHCNRAKLKMSFIEFKEWIRKAYWYFAWISKD